jgi:hypothetical protein
MVMSSLRPLRPLGMCGSKDRKTSVPVSETAVRQHREDQAIECDSSSYY